MGVNFIANSNDSDRRLSPFLQPLDRRHQIQFYSNQVIWIPVKQADFDGFTFGWDTNGWLFCWLCLNPVLINLPSAFQYYIRHFHCLCSIARILRFEGNLASPHFQFFISHYKHAHAREPDFMAAEMLSFSPNSSKNQSDNNLTIAIPKWKGNSSVRNDGYSFHSVV